MVTTAVESTRSLLKSAFDKAGPQLRSIVHMSSFASISGPEIAPIKYKEDQWDTVSEGIVAEQGNAAAWPVIYTAAKTAAERALWAFREEFKPEWYMAAVNPVYVHATFPADSIDLPQVLCRPTCCST